MSKMLGNTRLFVSAKKQMALIADEKLYAQIFHRIFTAGCSEMEMKMRKIMKKGMTGVLAAVLAAGMLAGCGNTDSTQTSTESTVQESTENTTQTTENALRNLDVENYVTLGDYQNLTVQVDPIVIDEADRDYQIMETYSKYATLENSGITDRAVENGDTVNIDYVGKKDGVAFDRGSAEGAFLVIGSGSYIDGFEDGLIGVKPGETVDLNLTFPEGYSNSELAGQAVVFTVTVNYIVELRDETVAEMGLENVSTVEQLQQYISDQMYTEQEADYDKKVRNALMSALLEQCTYGELPETVLENNKAYILNVINSAAAYGLDAETYTQTFFGMSADDYVNNYGAELTKQDITLQAIANRENLNVEDEELQNSLKEYAQNAGYSTVEEYLGDASIEEYRNYFMNEKVMDYLAEHATINN